MKKFRVISNDDDDVKREYRSKKDKQVRRVKKGKRNFSKHKKMDLEDYFEAEHVDW